MSRTIAVPREDGTRSIAVPRVAGRRRADGWEAVRYEDREPKWGESRADEYHAMRLFPNYAQFSRTKTGPTMSDTLGREYQIADGIDRLEDQDQGLVAGGSPYHVEPKLMEDSFLGTRSIVFSDIEDASPSYTFTLASPVSAEFREDVGGAHQVVRGAQLLYFRIPIAEKRKNPDLDFPSQGEELNLYHVASGSRARGTVLQVDGDQFPRTATGSVRLDNLIFLVDFGLLG